MQFTINRDTLLSSLTHAQGVIEKKKYLTNTVKCIDGA